MNGDSVVESFPLQRGDWYDMLALEWMLEGSGMPAQEHHFASTPPDQHVLMKHSSDSTYWCSNGVQAQS
jgi:hypothetical protein